MGDIHLIIVGLKATGLTSKRKLTFQRRPNGFVTISWVSDSLPSTHRTEVIKRTASPEWKEIVKLSPQSIDSTISFEMFDKGCVRLHSYGIVEKTVRDLLAGSPKLGATETNVSAYALLGGIVISLAELMGVADTLARIHPYVNFAWSVVSCVYSVVKNQLDRDEVGWDGPGVFWLEGVLRCLKEGVTPGS
ncbi:hypothetical protein PC9H_011707 [Pleurotus ostreatus]|uniref:C2 domain-containing protein n=1 Tax=Pleurotus ostreatus TaxID=5322 RepID=A0A8H6ZN94_PLEOS|nr:uncharacterized protein PC9H_011707 [Pleurotus ostreatus]KAF7421187.1 hypothetical protein PC9H_011707 [Pleurotus ostreatus]KAJ8690736.1 hypothetical protein PTI98_012140 [Pleurotus ostreatus]